MYNEAYRSLFANLNNRMVTYHSFCLNDLKGREVGAFMTTYELDAIPAPDTAQCYYRFEPGHYFVACPQAARDREKHGAAQGGKFFATAEERDAYVERYLNQADKRATKQFGPTYQG